MIGCTRCGRLHTDAEKAEGKRLTCTEVKQHWAELKTDHAQRFGHYPSVTIGDCGQWICLKCGHRLEVNTIKEEPE